METPRTIWMWWEQGYDQAPAVVFASHASWRRLNPTWQVRTLDRNTLEEWLPNGDVQRIFGVPKPHETISDEVRIELLFRHGGVWADATTVCAKPLDDWLPAHISNGFFAFDRPSSDRLVASWFLAAAQDSYIAKAWREAVAAFWRERTKSEDYFWFHKLFGELYGSDESFAAIWNATPKLTARHIFHFGPGDASVLLKPPSAEHLSNLSDPPSPVFKLTRKLPTQPQRDSLFDVLCRFAHGA
ncbi:MAG: capsular polysaccharide synthesis protein [Hyphomonadaceae bacterium]